MRMNVHRQDGVQGDHGGSGAEVKGGADVRSSAPVGTRRSKCLDRAVRMLR